MTTRTVPSLIICGASRGRYGYPWRIDGPKGIKRWLDSEERPTRPPKMISCDHSRHWDKDDGRRRRYPRNRSYVQHWVLSKKELRAIIEQWDMMSLDMPNLFLCADCAQRERLEYKSP